MKSVTYTTLACLLIISMNLNAMEKKSPDCSPIASLRTLFFPNSRKTSPAESPVAFAKTLALPLVKPETSSQWPVTAAQNIPAAPTIQNPDETPQDECNKQTPPQNKNYRKDLEAYVKWAPPADDEYCPGFANPVTFHACNPDYAHKQYLDY